MAAEARAIFHSPPTASCYSIVGAASSREGRGWFCCTGNASGSLPPCPTGFARRISAGIWQLVSFHVWRSSPVRRAQDVGYGCWRLVSFHLWRSSPIRRVQHVGYGCWRLVSFHLWRSSPVRRAWDVASGLCLFALATMLGWFSYPHRGWFERMHGHESLDFGNRASLEAGMDHFVQRGACLGRARLRQLREIERCSLDSLAGDGNEGVSAAEMKAELETVSTLFDDPSTFAVAKQSEVRDWKQALFPMGPFRRLQPGTVSQVLAPLAQTIFVDRAKLETLGVPRTKLTHTSVDALISGSGGRGGMALL